MTITVVGIGLIGGSLALSLKQSGFAQTVIGVDNKTEHVIKALQLKLVDKVSILSDAIKESDIIILATPVDSLTTLLPDVLNQISDNQIVIEGGSTKKPVIEAVRNHPRRKQFVATHPMAGTEFSGPEAALDNLFLNKVCVLCDTEDSNPEAVQTITNLYESMGMRVIMMETSAHDLHTAYISHISHICSFALAATVLAKEKNENSIFDLASTGFASTVRLAKSNPETWIPIFRQNQENILDVLDEYINTLLKFKGLMLAESYDKLKEYLVQANDIKRVLDRK
jgi:prephenate dehydrogenase